MLTRIAKAVVAYLAVAPSLISGLSPESSWGRELSQSPQNLGDLIEDPEFVMATIAENTQFDIGSEIYDITASDYQTFSSNKKVPPEYARFEPGSPIFKSLEKLQRAESLAYDYKPFEDKQSALSILNDLASNPDLNKISQIFALNQLAIPYEGVKFTAVHTLTTRLLGCAAYAIPRLLKPAEGVNAEANVITVLTKETSILDVRGLFAHEATHIAMERLYENKAKPYPIDSQKKFENVFELTNNNLKALKENNRHLLSNNEKRFIRGWFTMQEHYPESELHSELIVLLPQLLATYRLQVKDLPQELQTAIKPYLEYWDDINQDISAYISRVQNVLSASDIIGDHTETIRLSMDTAHSEGFSALLLEGRYNLESFKDLDSLHLLGLNLKGYQKALLENRINLEEYKSLTPEQLNVLSMRGSQQALLEGRLTLEDLSTEELKNIRHDLYYLLGLEGTQQALFEGRLKIEELKCLSDEGFDLLSSLTVQQALAGGDSSVQEILDFSKNQLKEFLGHAKANYGHIDISISTDQAWKQAYCAILGVSSAMLSCLLMKHHQLFGRDKPSDAQLSTLKRNLPQMNSEDVKELTGTICTLLCDYSEYRHAIRKNRLNLQDIKELKKAQLDLLFDGRIARAVDERRVSIQDIKKLDDRTIYGFTSTFHAVTHLEGMKKAETIKQKLQTFNDEAADLNKKSDHSDEDNPSLKGA